MRPADITIGITYRQLVTPDELRSSVNVIGRMVAWGGQPVGAVLGGLVAATAGVRPAIAAAGTVLALDALAAAWALRATPTHQ